MIPDFSKAELHTYQSGFKVVTEDRNYNERQSHWVYREKYGTLD